MTCARVYLILIRRVFCKKNRLVAKILKEKPLTTASARSKLATGEYARRLDADSAIWYRKGKRGGVWFARWRNYGPGANYKQAPVGAANDTNDKPTAGLLTFDQAERMARQIVELARQEIAAVAAGPVLTVRSAVETYVVDRDARDSRRKGRKVRSDAGQRLGRYVIGQPARGKQDKIDPTPLADIALHALKESDLLAWRTNLPDDVKATSRQRLINDLKAALNSAYASNRDRLDPTLPAIIKHGLRAMDLADEAEPVARENQILTDGEVGRLLKATREIDAEHDWGGDLFRLVLVLAATGARFSQIARMRVTDCQIAERRLLVPVSRKGRGAKSGSITVPIGQDVLAELAPVVAGRPEDAPLFERWRFVQAKGGIKWQRDRRGPWQSAAEMVRPWQMIRDRAALPDVIPYALRHSSIVNGIKANLPIRLVAALHDTSTAMIERHYSKWITTGLEELARAAIVPLVATKGGNDASAA